MGSWVPGWVSGMATGARLGEMETWSLGRMGWSLGPGLGGWDRAMGPGQDELGPGFWVVWHEQAG